MKTTQKMITRSFVCPGALVAWKTQQGIMIFELVTGEVSSTTVSQDGTIIRYTLPTSRQLIGIWNNVIVIFGGISMLFDPRSRRQA